MTRHEPPHLAVSLLSRWLPADDPLTGDLVEEFGAGRSRSWFWRQTVAAVSRRGPRALRVGGVLAVVLFAGTTSSWVTYAHAVARHTELPRLVRQLTIDEMIRSVRTTDVHAVPTFEGSVVDVTGVLQRIISRSIANARDAFALHVTGVASVPGVPGVGATFSLDPSVDVAALVPGHTVTLRCRVTEDGISQSSCLVIPLP